MEKVVNKSDYEIERGKPMPSLKHAVVQSNILLHVGHKYFKKYRLLSELNTVINDEKRIPDVAIYLREEAIVDFEKEDVINITNIPLGAIEILSPKQGLAELVSKANFYFQGGTKSYWLVLPELKSVYVFNKPYNYEVFAKDDVLKDKWLNIEIPLSVLFA